MQASAGQSVVHASRPLVLVVDDSVDVIRLLALVLGATCDVIFAKNGELGVELAVKRQPILVLLDVEMPGMNGREVWSVLRGRPETSSIPIVFVSGDDPRPQLGVADPPGWIRKPFAASEVQAVVQQYVNADGQP